MHQGPPTRLPPADTLLDVTFPTIPSSELPAGLFETHALGCLGMQASITGPALDLSVVPNAQDRKPGGLGSQCSCSVTLRKLEGHIL